MVNRLESAELVVTEKFDMIFEQLRRQEVNRARLELRLAEYNDAMAEARTKTSTYFYGVKHPFLCIVCPA